MRDYATEEQLTKERLEEDDVQIPGVGWVRVRALSRSEVFRLQKIDDVAKYERQILTVGCVIPTVTDATVMKWQDACPAGELEIPVQKIKALSGLGDDADKSGVPDDGDGPADGVRALPSGEAGDDGRGPTGADG